ncbi:MAG: aldose epimerase family protein [Pseudomonadota bacterium]
MTNIEAFGTLPNGQMVEQIKLKGGGLSTNILTYGAVVQDLRLDGHAPPLVLGLNTLEDYLNHSKSFGIIAGRCANRIAHGRFEIDGTSYQLDQNFLEKHHLHGGSDGCGKRNWHIEQASDHSVSLSINLDDGHMGYPGEIRILVHYALLDGGVLDIRFETMSDEPTLCNLAAHSYFNLDGSRNILDHTLQMDADHFLPVDDELIPTGEQKSVEGDGFDFRSAKPLRDVCAQGLIDHNFCLSHGREALRQVAVLSAPATGVSMTIRTTEPGLQIFDGSKLDVPVTGLDDQKLGAYAGIAMEPQVWPDAINHPDWAQPVLRPGEIYRQHSQFVFSKP